jgi:cytochrome c biogenesis protein CcmG/thiol:disulfide interchange protein DsbE
VTAARLGWGAGGAAAAVLLAALAWGLGHPANTPTDTVLGRQAPEIVVQALDGNGGQLKLSDLRGRPAVVNFWASWCAPCRQEEGALKSAAQRWSGSVAFLGVDIQDSAAAARAYQAEVRYPYPVGQPVRGVPQSYGVKAPPETFFIDGRGVVVARFLGPLDAGLIERYLQLVGVR